MKLENGIIVWGVAAVANLGVKLSSGFDLIGTITSLIPGVGGVVYNILVIGGMVGGAAVIGLKFWGGEHMGKGLTIAVVVLVVLAIFMFAPKGNTQSGVNSNTPAAPGPSTGSGICPNGPPSGLQTFTEYVNVKNDDNITYHQLATTIYFGVSGDLATGVTTSGPSFTTSSGATETLTSWSSPVCTAGSLYVVSDSNTAGVVLPGVTTDVQGKTFRITGDQSAPLEFAVYDSLYNIDNGTVASNGAFARDVNTTTHALSSGQSVSGKIQAQLVTGSSVFGTDMSGFLVSAHSNSLSAISANGISLGTETGGLTGGKMGTCPVDAQRYDQADVCWKFSQFNQATPTPYTFGYTVKNDQATSAGASDDVKFTFNDYAIFFDSDNKLHEGLFSSSGTDQGVRRGTVLIDIS